VYDTSLVLGDGVARVAVSLTTFVDFAATTGLAKVGAVQRAKSRYARGYLSSFDYWLTLRNAITSLHSEDRPSATLDQVLVGLNEGKVGNYRLCIDGYKKWLRRRRLPLLRKRHRGEWTSGNLTVRVNPDLVLELDTVPHAIKLYFSAPPLSKTRIDLSLHLIRRVVGPSVRPAVLDVRRSKLYGNVRAAPGVDALLEGEARLFVSMWDAI
jgi:hypothetical protein